MSMCRKSGALMNAKAAAATILLLVLVGCYASFTHGAVEAEGTGGGRRELDESEKLCIERPCDAYPNQPTCYCCPGPANGPCYQFYKLCILDCPRRLGSPPALAA